MKNERIYWRVVALISMFIAVLIMGIWYKVDTGYQPNQAQLTSVAQAKNEISKLYQSQGQSIEHKVNVPTGVFIHSMHFDSANDIYFNGYLWQKFPKGLDIGEGQTFIFPEEVKGIKVPVVEHDVLVGNERVIVWYFEVLARQPFNYSHYPLDHKTAWLKILPPIGEDWVFISDLSGYPKTGLQDKFGLDNNIVLGGWKVDDTFFDYKLNTYQTNLGFLDTMLGEVPELHFNVVLKRKFSNAFVVHLIPMITVFVLLFALLLTLSHCPKKEAAHGFSIMGIIGSIAALFFVVVLSHAEVRTQFATQEVVYIEFYYLTMYVLMILTVVVSFIYNVPNRWFSPLVARDALWIKLAYWPASLFALFIVSYLVLMH
ncbi:hypothetical protein Q8W40_11185 [Vibrio penaeicida]|uniref:hypothetical protein n=1 Tax=Vibrio penaeicida TaxID=104609 RepID=UPI0027327559|nr:hypothetical protein [Vibrio penaeicida]MDP2572748.1 hypothetical protein [Vibrio penaeicida]